MTVSAPQPRSQFFSLADIGKHTTDREPQMTGVLFFAPVETFKAAEEGEVRKAEALFQQLLSAKTQPLAALQQTAVQIIPKSASQLKAAVQISGPALGSAAACLQFIFQDGREVTAEFNAGTGEGKKALPASLFFDPAGGGNRLTTTLDSGLSVSLSTLKQEARLEVGTPEGSQVKVGYTTYIDDEKVKATPRNASYRTHSFSQDRDTELQLAYMDLSSCTGVGYRRANEPVMTVRVTSGDGSAFGMHYEPSQESGRSRSSFTPGLRAESTAEAPIPITVPSLADLATAKDEAVDNLCREFKLAQ